MTDFRFENLEVWKVAIEIGHRLADLADLMEGSGKGKGSDSARLREFAPKISGILAAGSAAPTKVQFSVWVGQARQVTLEIANLIIFYGERELLTEEQEAELINILKRESKMLENFRQSLERADRVSQEQVEALV